MKQHEYKAKCIDKSNISIWSDIECENNMGKESWIIHKLMILLVTISVVVISYGYYLAYGIDLIIILLNAILFILVLVFLLSKVYDYTHKDDTK